MAERRNRVLLIKNMVCPRCTLTVKSILDTLNISYHNVLLGEVDLVAELTIKKTRELENELKKYGFDLIENRITKIVEDIKKLTLQYLEDGVGDRKRRLSSYISDHLHYDYSYLSDVFSSIEGITIERYFIVQRIEKVKELIVYDELSLTEISYQTGFSSVHHLSAQFKKETGFNASHFRKIGFAKRQSIDRI